MEVLYEYLFFALFKIRIYLCIVVCTADSFFVILDVRNSKGLLLRKPWINNDIINKIGERNKTKTRAKFSKSDEDWKSYRKLRNSVTDMIRKAKRSYISKSILNNKGNCAAMWKSLRCMLPNKKNMKVIQKLSINGEDIFGLKEIATRLKINFSTGNAIAL